MLKPLPVNVSNDTLTIIIGVATIAVAFISFGAEFNQKSTLHFLKSFKYRTPVLILLFVIIFGSTIIKDKDNDVRNYNDLLRRDSVNQKKFNESLKISSDATGETMAKYFLMYNAAQRKIEELVRDSSKRKVFVKAISDKAELQISDLIASRDGDTLKLKVFISTPHAAAYNVKFRYCNVLRYDNVLVFLDNPYLFNVKHPLTTPGYGIFKYITPINGLGLPPQVYFYIYGSYTDSDNKQYPINILESYGSQFNALLELTDKEYLWIADFIRKHNISVPPLKN